MVAELNRTLSWHGKDVELLCDLAINGVMWVQELQYGILKIINLTRIWKLRLQRGSL